MSVAEMLTPASYIPRAVAPPPPSPTRADWKRRRAEALARLEKGHPELEEQMAAAKGEVAEAWARYQGKLVAAVEAENRLKAARAGDEREVARASAELSNHIPAELAEFARRVEDRIRTIQRTSAGDHERVRLDAEIRELFRIRDRVTYKLAPSGVDGPELQAEIASMIRGVETAIARADARSERTA